MERKKRIVTMIVVIIIAVSTIALFYQWQKEEPLPRSSFNGELNRLTINNTTDSATFIVKITNKFPENEKFPIYDEDNESYVEPLVLVKSNESKEVTPNFTYVDVDDNRFINTGDKLVIHNRSEYIGIETDLMVFCYNGRLDRTPSGYYYDRI